MLDALIKPELLGYTVNRKHLIESSNALSFLDNEEDVMTIDIEEGIGYKYTGDFHGLLNYLDVPNHIHNVTTLINGLTSSIDYNGNFFTIKLLIPKVVSRLEETIYTK